MTRSNFDKNEVTVKMWKLFVICARVAHLYDANHPGLGVKIEDKVKNPTINLYFCSFVLIAKNDTFEF